MLKTERFIIKPTEECDLESLYSALVNIDYPFWPKFTQSKSEFFDSYQKTKGWTDSFKRLLVFECDKMIGLINFFTVAPYSSALELGYIVFNRKNHNKGIMSEAIPAVIKYIFEAIDKCNRVQVGITTGNQGSLHLAKKLGFSSEGVLRKFFNLRGKDVDVEILSLLRSEFKRG